MTNGRAWTVGLGLAVAMGFIVGCGKKEAASTPIAITATPQHHEHKPPHGGAPVVLGDEAYHLELVLDATEGKLQVYVLDGEMEDFVRIAAPSLEIETKVNGAPQALVLQAVANSATGETLGDTALFEARADWLTAVTKFDATLKTITIRGTIFTDVKFNFPQGNDKD